MDVPSIYCVVDDRKPSDLKTVTISNYKKVDVIKALHDDILAGNLERACRWTAELHCSGRSDAVWKELLENAPQYLNLANPHITTWLWYKHHLFNHLLKSFTPKYRYEHRNNQEMRNLLIDIITVVTSSKKNNLEKIIPKVTKKELSVKNYQKKITSTHLRYIQKIVNPHDPSEIQIAINEVANIFMTVNFKLQDVIYWYLWLETLQKSKKEWESFICFPHSDPTKNPENVNPKLHGDWVWVFWRTIIAEAEERNNAVKDQIDALYQIYQWKFTKSSKKRKQYVIFAACALLCDNVKWKTKMIQNVKLRIQACSNVNAIYKLIDEKLDPYRTISRTEYCAYVKPLVAKKKKRKKGRKKVKEEIKKETDRIVIDKRADFFINFNPAPKTKTKILCEYFPTEPEIKVVHI